MKMHEAMRLGAMNRPQAFGGLQKAGGTCALGAAFDAVGILEGLESIWMGSPTESCQRIKAIFPIWDKPIGSPCDCFSLHQFPAGSVVAHLNDWHRWSREKIADWLEAVEAEDDLLRQSLPPASGSVSRGDALPAETQGDAHLAGALVSSLS